MKIVGIVGSNAKKSYNRMLLQFIASEYKDLFEFELLEISEIPLFNQSNDQTESEAIEYLNQKIKAADGVIVSSPEHNRTIPPALKSTIEWLSFKIHPLMNKPLAVIGASYFEQGSSRAQLHLRQILTSPGVGAYLYPGDEFLLADVKNAFNKEGQLKDKDTIEFLGRLLENFSQYVELIAELEETSKS